MDSRAWMLKFAIGAMIAGIWLVGVVTYIGWNTSMKYATCSSSHYAAIVTGMTKQDIVEELGAAGREVVKAERSENRFGQGDLEPDIAEGWIYDISNHKTIEVYFDINNVVIGKNCGEG